jgi:hypothetical protein
MALSKAARASLRRSVADAITEASGPLQDLRFGLLFQHHRLAKMQGQLEVIKAGGYTSLITDTEAFLRGVAEDG